ncbi:hypothetical protein L6164_019373 [Bauhinia variegata]|uniref:Uncharacterized protein n=1 Tax=Bauhinia variegata TaxID=167791 RepID=A0ACB9MRT8_BAUVA|nr:hypothetical protein L6164_019373 [Bauhinia variegata]
MVSARFDHPLIRFRWRLKMRSERRVTLRSPRSYVNLVDEAKLASEGVKVPGNALLSISESLVAGGIAGGVEVSSPIFRGFFHAFSMHSEKKRPSCFVQRMATFCRIVGLLLELWGALLSSAEECGWRPGKMLVTGDGKGKALIIDTGMIDAFRKAVPHEGFGASLLKAFAVRSGSISRLKSEEIH